MKERPVFKSAEGKNSILAVYDSLLGRWPVAFQKLIIKTRHGDTFVIVCGEKTLPPIILLHGSSSNSAMWIGDISRYCKHYCVYAVDIPGECGRSQESRLDLNTSACAEWLYDIFMSLKIHKASIVGISMGGWMALKFSTNFPHMIDKLVLLCPSGISPQKASFMFYLLPMMFLGRWGRKRIIQKIYGKDNVSAEAFQYSKLIGDNFNPFTGVLPIFSDDQLGRLTMPLLLIVGDKDVFFDSKKTVKRLVKLLPEAHINLLPGVGHVLVNQIDKIILFLTAS